MQIQLRFSYVCGAVLFAVFFFVQFRDKILVIEKKKLIHSSQQSDTYISSSLYCVLFVDIKDKSINIIEKTIVK